MRGLIYRIECKTNPDIRYIGSTLQELRYRWRDHKLDFEKWKRGARMHACIYKYFADIGIENFTMIKLKEYNVVDRKHLTAYEQLWMNKLKNINRSSAFRIHRFYEHARWRTQHRQEQCMKYRQSEKGKQYQKDYDKSRREQRKEYYQENKEVYKKRYLDNLEKIQRQRKERYQNSKVECTCGLLVSTKFMGNHQKTQRHIDKSKIIQI